MMSDFSEDKYNDATYTTRGTRHLALQSKRLSGIRPRKQERLKKSGWVVYRSCSSMKRNFLHQKQQ